MVARIRVLIVDDAVVIRRLLTDCLGSDPEIEVIGTAPNGRIALTKIGQMNPDLVVLDIEMPEMDGLQTLAAIRKITPHLPVVMFSTLTERGAVATLEALSLGASDYVAKPANVGHVSVALARVQQELVPKIKALCRPIAAGPSPAAPARARPSGGSCKTGVVAIGVSTGGPNALAQVLPNLMQNFPVPILIVQHMPPLFTRLLAERISAFPGLKAQEGVQEAPLLPGQIWIAPGGRHMEVVASRTGARLRIHDEPPENSCRPAVDVLFRSVANVYGPRSLAVVLTGMGQDGLRGSRHIHEAGGQVIVQDEASSVVWGMPGAVSQAGLANEAFPLREIAEGINRKVMSSPFSASLALRVSPPGPEPVNPVS